MPAAAKSYPDSSIVEIYVTGKLSVDDYHAFVPVIDQKIAEHGKVKLAFIMSDFHGWRLGALWEDVKFDLGHYHKIERIAFIGESLWEKGMARFCKPFSSARFRFFDLQHEQEAKIWLDIGTLESEEESPNDLVCVYTLNDAMHGEIIAIALRGEGIPCHVSDIHQGMLTGILEVDILVRNSDVDRAAAYINQHEEKK